MSDKKTHIGIALDRSGSMSRIRDQIIDGFNEQLDVVKEQAEEGGETTVTFITFGGHYSGGTRKPIETIMEKASPEDVEKLSHDNYRAGGLTPMYDGVMSVVHTLEELDDGGDDTAMLLLVFSDGLENHSQEYNSEQVIEKFGKLKKSDRWTIVYIGANQDLAAIERHLGIGAENTVVLPDTSAVTVNATTASATASMESYMSSRGQGMTKTEYAASMKDTLAHQLDNEEDETATNS